MFRDSLFFIVSRDAARHVSTMLVLFHHQFLSHSSTILLNDVDKIYTFVPLGGVNVDDLAALLLADLLSHEVIDLHLGHIRTFHGELACGRVGIELGLFGELGDA